MNNNKTNLTALEARCKGVFSTNGYLNTGTDAKYVSPEEKPRDSYKGKQFQVTCEKSGRLPNTYFGLDNSKKHLYIGEGLLFVDRVRFQDSQPEKPGKGFLTSDYNKRGEFTDTIRTEQYRSQLKQEEKISKKRQEKEPTVAIAQLAPEKVGPETFLYDRVYDQSRPGREAQKLSRDTGNPTMLSKARDVGTYNTTYLLQHRPPQPSEICRPEHARVAVVRDTFYEKDMAHSHLVC